MTGYTGLYVLERAAVQPSNLHATGYRYSSRSESFVSVNSMISPAELNSLEAYSGTKKRNVQRLQRFGKGRVCGPHTWQRPCQRLAEGAGSQIGRGATDFELA